LSQNANRTDEQNQQLAKLQQKLDRKTQRMQRFYGGRGGVRRYHTAASDQVDTQHHELLQPQGAQQGMSAAVDQETIEQRMPRFYGGRAGKPKWRRYYRPASDQVDTQHHELLQPHGEQQGMSASSISAPQQQTLEHVAQPAGLLCGGGGCSPAGAMVAPQEARSNDKIATGTQYVHYLAQHDPAGHARYMKEAGVTLSNEDMPTINKTKKAIGKAKGRKGVGSRKRGRKGYVAIQKQVPNKRKRKK